MLVVDVLFADACLMFTLEDELLLSDDASILPPNPAPPPRMIAATSIAATKPFDAGFFGFLGFLTFTFLAFGAEYC